mmetsp:Transcript_46358/g.110385  ORF Transcript_46358/g.110385 Transcript_46358/m.110385 type:complete len:226 (-) Transcript_46358:627-1304(-)
MQHALPFDLHSLLFSIAPLFVPCRCRIRTQGAPCSDSGHVRDGCPQVRLSSCFLRLCLCLAQAVTQQILGSHHLHLNLRPLLLIQPLLLYAGFLASHCSLPRLLLCQGSVKALALVAQGVLNCHAVPRCTLELDLDFQLLRLFEHRCSPVSLRSHHALNASLGNKDRVLAPDRTYLAAVLLAAEVFRCHGLFFLRELSASLRLCLPCKRHLQRPILLGKDCHCRP